MAAKRVPKVMENLLVLTAFTGGSPTAYREVRETSPPPPAIESMKPANPTSNVRMTITGILTLVTENLPRSNIEVCRHSEPELSLMQEADF